MDSKVCSKCSVEKNLIDFHKHKLGAFGVDSVCKICKKEQKKELIEQYKEINSTRDYEVEKDLLIQCTNCKKDKKCSSFHKSLSSKRGYVNYCIECSNEKINTNRRETPEFKKCSICGIIKSQDNFDKQSVSRDNLDSSCKQCNSEILKIKYLNNKQYYLDKNKKSRLRNSHKYKNSNAEYYIKNKERILSTAKKYYVKNKNEIKKKRQDYVKTDNFKNNEKRKKENPVYLLKLKLQNLILHEFTKQELKKSKRTAVILDCTMEEFKQHIESQFLNWMNWSNYGNCETNEYNCSWHLDHIIPISYAKTEEDIILLNHWSNFQPLCSKVNKWEKRNKIFSVTNLELGITILENKS